MGDHSGIIVVGILVGLLQGVILILLNMGIKKVTDVCAAMTQLQRDLSGKAGIEDQKEKHEKIEVSLGEYGDRILTLELGVRVKQRRKDDAE